VTTVDKERLPITTYIDHDFIITVESVAADVFVWRQTVLLDEFLFGSVTLVLNAFVEAVNVIARIPYVFFTRTTSPDDVSAFCLVDHVLNKLDVLPLHIVLKVVPECSNNRKILKPVIALIPVTTLNRAEVLPLESSRIRAATSDVGDFIRVDTDDCEGIVDGVGTGVPPAKEVAII